ncbi:uncharacterized protein LOC131944338 [Physella acuta]|uniref:uncharacterized protein LOC131944338 n=1 Tax=Physella acuta TaxID=109671 RepID=UPI0027DD052B|nr:uncharacterized protein LOC131944338 [Physella acuta]
MACVFPELDVYNPSILKLSGLNYKPIKCDKYPPDITYLKKNQILVNVSRITAGFVSCKYREIYKHPTDDNDAKFGDWSESFNTSIILSETEEFLLVECQNISSNTTSKIYHALIPRREDFSKVKLKKRLKMFQPKETLNVVMIGMDGVSRYQYMRSMNLTYNFLMKELNSFDMTMYTQIGINTFPNLLPLLTGYNATEVGEWWDKSTTNDQFDLIWDDYRKAGYKTLYTEDQPSIGSFHYHKKGFQAPPTLYYNHPVCIAMEKDKEFRRFGYNCAGSQPEINFHLNYVQRLLDTYPDSPIFALLFHNTLTHNDMTKSKMVDEHTFEFYNTLRKKGYLNNTLLITFSDHGPRWGPIRSTLHGMVESRAPYAILTFPKWFLDKYPDVETNLKTNTKRLTTHYDVHATLQDLLYFKASGIVPLTPRKHGTSLFNVIPESRTCEDIPISMEFCLCNQAQLNKVTFSFNTTTKFGEVIVKKINGKRNAKMCVELKLEKVLQIVKITLPHVSKQDYHLYKVKIETAPGKAIYEGTVYTAKDDKESLVQHLGDYLAKGNTKNIRMGESVDRFTFYAGQADCEEDATVKPYCYCKNLAKS